MGWRSLDPGGDQPRRLEKSLDKLAVAIGGSEAAGLTALFTRWREVVGEAIASHSRPVSISKGVLIVAVDHPGWATQIRYLEADLVGKLKTSFEHLELTRIEVRVSGRSQ